MKKMLLAAVSVLALSASAFRLPEISTNGVSARILGLDQLPGVAGSRDKKNLKCVEVDASKPMTLEVVLSNSTAKAVSGTFKMWMNDDWRVSGPESERIALSPGEAKKVVRSATALERVLPALYPVHARYELDGGVSLHPIAIFKAKTANRAFFRSPLPARSALNPGSYRLDHRFDRKVVVTVGGKEREIKNPDRIDEVSRGFFRKTDPKGYTSGPELAPARRGFYCHPPYAHGTGEIASEFTFSTPAGEPLKLRFFNALQHTSKGSNPGDGVVARVLAKAAGEREFRVLYEKHIAKDGIWYPGEVDLADFAGKNVSLRLAIDVGKRGNSTFDGCAWTDAIVDVGNCPATPSGEEWLQREKLALAKAEAALRGGADPQRGVYLLEDSGRRYGAGVELGRAGILDGAIVFTDGRSSVAYRGFECEIDGEKIGWLKSVPDARCRIYAEKGALKIAWDLSRAYRRDDGSPRFTLLKPGPANKRPSRVYGGFGCVFENPRRFSLRGSGFVLSTRHAGIDYEDSLSVVQAVDTAPIEFEVDGENNIARLAAKNDTVFFFVPSSMGAFDAARRFAAVSGYRMSPGVPRILGKMCLDDWSNRYAVEAANLRLAAKYGLGGSLYLQHNWQRWGYDYRLPEVYPPKGDVNAFMDMRKAAEEGGFLFGIHDNYVDFYPDAEGFSYDHICFNEDGTPLEAWYNPRPRALSYRWLPQAIHPALRKNMALERDGFSPNALFIDVFTASLPKDVIDREGKFHPASRNQQEWCKAFDECREVYGVPDAVMVSEAGNDMLIGHIDAVESDHFRPEKIVVDAKQYSVGERVPWHDMATHGKMVLFGGGLGHRYSQPDWEAYTGDNELHGYGSDDYFCTTIIGGRSPMAGGAFGSVNVKTHWLLNDIAGAFARGEFLKFEFLDGIRRQRSVFSTGEVVINRSEEDWSWNGETLPRYGFIARAAGDLEAAVVARDGVRYAYSKRPGRWFVDARAPIGDGIPSVVNSSPASFEMLSPSRARLKLNWRTNSEITDDFRPFCHIIPLTNTSVISHHARIVGIDGKVRKEPGDHKGVYIDISLPAKVQSGDYSIRYGMFSPKGPRLRISGCNDRSYRIRAGVLSIAANGNSSPAALAWRNERTTDRDRELGINSELKPVDFGGIRTFGSFRFDFPRPGFKAAAKRLFRREKPEWRITPLPGSMPFAAEIDLARFGGKGVKVAAVEPVDPTKYAAKPIWRQQGDKLHLDLDANSFAYRIIAE